MDARAVGRRLRLAREARGLTRPQLAALIDGPGAGQVHAWERRGGMRADSAVRLSQALGVSVGWLLTGEGLSPDPAVPATVPDPGAAIRPMARGAGIEVDEAT